MRPETPFAAGYIAAIRASVSPDTRDAPLADETLARIREDCERFEQSTVWQAFNDALQGNLNEEGEECAAGGALWLTRNHYDWAIAAGFWADVWGAFSDDLAEAACGFPPLTPYHGDDGLIRFSPMSPKC